MENKNSFILGIIFSILIISTFIVSINVRYNSTVSRVKSIYKEINTLLYKAKDRYGDFNLWSDKNASNDKKIKTFINNLDISKKVDCGLNDKNGKCWWSDELINYTNNGVNKYVKDSYTFIDKQGRAVYAYKDDYWGYMMVYDVNGKDKGPNARGKDIFYFQTGPNNKEFVPGGEEQLGSNKKLIDGCFKLGACCAWVIKTGNMEYLKVDKEGYCPNGKQLTWFNTTCR